MDRQQRDIFETLFKDSYKGLFLHAFCCVRNEEEARDIVNDVFEYVREHYPQLDTSVSLKPLLYTMVRNRSVDYLRRIKARERFDHYYHQVNREDYSDYHERSASFIKMRNLGISYALPKSWLSKMHFNDVRIKAQVDNLWYWAANNAGIDPESFDVNSGSRSDKLMPTYSVGISLGF